MYHIAQTWECSRIRTPARSSSRVPDGPLTRASSAGCTSVPPTWPSTPLGAVATGQPTLPAPSSVNNRVQTFLSKLKRSVDWLLCCLWKHFLLLFFVRKKVYSVIEKTLVWYYYLLLPIPIPTTLRAEMITTRRLWNESLYATRKVATNQNKRINISSVLLRPLFFFPRAIFLLLYVRSFVCCARPIIRYTFDVFGLLLSLSFSISFLVTEFTLNCTKL